MRGNGTIRGVAGFSLVAAASPTAGLLPFTLTTVAGMALLAWVIIEKRSRGEWQ